MQNAAYIYVLTLQKISSWYVIYKYVQIFNLPCTTDSHYYVVNMNKTGYGMYREWKW